MIGRPVEYHYKHFNTFLSHDQHAASVTHRTSGIPPKYIAVSEADGGVVRVGGDVAGGQQRRAHWLRQQSRLDPEDGAARSECGAGGHPERPTKSRARMRQRRRGGGDRVGAAACCGVATQRGGEGGILAVLRPREDAQRPGSPPRP
ncbi:hypothetical protein BHE74_00009508 [Ensete ventricosum]|uniref:Uncharacterized protein n=1 Tax=Ensete ventricosum TaxID=4639 RepID=A0A444FH49_ENSVE|nr:hypothetical protein GW17_00013854 [Ensete ventricosum]RWW82047.1 hypothetical protein BHE74_00009508 [Ensete ventricosum]RZR71236.1 hypothetical protein BHM03_00004222 [Ensete ventricosum]